QQAAKDTGSTLKYSNDPDPAKQATLIQNAVDSKVDGIATTLATPDALKDTGALMYFGSDENLAGSSAGERIVADGAKHPLCVIQAAGSVALEARCAG